jgi:hypothetical protein
MRRATGPERYKEKLREKAVIVYVRNGENIDKSRL